VETGLQEWEAPRVQTSAQYNHATTR